MRLSFTAKVWLYPGDAAWHFVTIDRVHADRVRKNEEGRPRRGWGAVRVEAKIGKTTWETSMFPVKEDGTYILPLKASVRKKEGIMVGDAVKLAIVVS